MFSSGFLSRKLSCDKALGWLVASLVFGVFLLGSSFAEADQLELSNPTPTWATMTSPTSLGSSLTSFSVNVTFCGTALAAGETVILTYKDCDTGRTVATSVETIGTGGTLTATVPAVARPLGHKLEVTYYDATTAMLRTSDEPLLWYSSGFFTATPTLKVDPLGLPGITAVQSWFIDEIAHPIVGTHPTAGVFMTTIAQSNLDLRYTDLGSGLYEAYVVGDSSFFRLADDTSIGFPDGTLFGTIQYTDFDGTTASGTFDFFAIGLAGSWHWDARTNYTGGTGVVTGAFAAPAISRLIVPEPHSLLLLGLGCVSLLGYGYRCRKRLW